MIIKNYLYNLMYQILTICLPIITIPYISRVLGAEGMGIYALTNSYVQYFILIGMLGLATYCSRQIAYVRDDKKELSKTFWELNFVRLITVGISTVVYYLCFGIFFNNSYRMICMIQGINLISCILDISWLFIGLENFKKVVIRNTIVKVSGVILIVLFVKDKSQVGLYTTILTLTQLIGQAVMWFDVPKDIKFLKPTLKNSFSHIRESMKLFIPQIAINIYLMLDRTMLGMITNEVQVGLYDNSQKIIRVASTIVTSLASVTIPRMSNLYKNSNLKEFKEMAYKSLDFISFLVFPMSFGLIGASSVFTAWFYGTGFEGIKPMFYIGGGMIISLGLTSILGNQILISTKREKQFGIAVTIGAFVNLILNLFLINHFGGIGTTISSIIAEYSGMLIMLYYIRDILNINKIVKHMPKYLITSIIMMLGVYWIGYTLEANIITTIIQMTSGIVFYLLIMILTKDKNIEFIKSKFLGSSNHRKFK